MISCNELYNTIYSMVRRSAEISTQPEPGKPGCPPSGAGLFTRQTPFPEMKSGMSPACIVMLLVTEVLLVRMPMHVLLMTWIGRACVLFAMFWPLNNTQLELTNNLHINFYKHVNNYYLGNSYRDRRSLFRNFVKKNFNNIIVLILKRPKISGFFEILNSFQVTAFTTSYLLQPSITTFTTSGL